MIPRNCCSRTLKGGSKGMEPGGDGRGRWAAPLLLAAVAGCATDPAPIAEGPRHVGMPAPRAGAAPACCAGEHGRHRPADHGVRQDANLRTRAAELGADAVINVRYGTQSVGLVPWSQISGEGQAMRYTGQQEMR